MVIRSPSNPKVFKLLGTRVVKSRLFKVILLLKKLFATFKVLLKGVNVALEAALKSRYIRGSVVNSKKL